MHDPPHRGRRRPRDTSDQIKISWVKHAILATALAAAVAAPYWVRSRDAREHHGVMVGLCADDTRCRSAVEEHADACFKAHYRLGRPTQTLTTGDVVACVNQRSGKAVSIGPPAGG